MPYDRVRPAGRSGSRTGRKAGVSREAVWSVLRRHAAQLKKLPGMAAGDDDTAPNSLRDVMSRKGVSSLQNWHSAVAASFFDALRALLLEKFLILSAVLQGSLQVQNRASGGALPNWYEARSQPAANDWLTACPALPSCTCR